LSKEILVVGLGEIGSPLFELIKQKHSATGIDIQPVNFVGQCGVMHICFPFDFDGFLAECVRYIRKYNPDLTIINSTVAPGTTRRVQEETAARVVNSPIRGKHWKMKDELLRYTKFIGGSDREACRGADAHFRSLGMKTKVFGSPETTEIAKLSETTYFGLLIAWAQELERYCDRLDCVYDEVVSFCEEIAYLPPVKYTPGIIGGHCVMPNIAILRDVFESDLLAAISSSNERKAAREAERSELRGSARNDASGKAG